MATFFNALGALGSGIKQARQERMEGEQQELGKLFQLFQLNESRKNEAKQDWLDRQYERQRTGGELTDDDLEIKHRFESARDYGKQIESQMALNIGGPRGKGLVQGRLSGLAKAFGIDHKEDLPDLAGGFGGGSFGAGGSSSASPQSVEASQSGAPPSSMGMGGPPPSVSQSDSLPPAPGGGVSPLAARLASSWGDPLNDVRAPGGPVFTPGSVGGSPGGTQEGPVPAAPFAFSQYPQPMSPGAIEQRSWRNAYVPGMPMDRIGMERGVADQQRFHAQQLLDMVGDYVQHIHANERPGEKPSFEEAMRDPRFAQLEGALRQAQAAKIYVNGKPEDLLRAGTIHDTLKSYFSDYERPEDRGKKTVKQQLEEKALPAYSIPAEQRTPQQQQDIKNLEDFTVGESTSGEMKAINELVRGGKSYLDAYAEVQRRRGLAYPSATLPDRVVVEMPDGTLKWVTTGKGQVPKEGAPPTRGKTQLDLKDYIGKVPGKVGDLSLDEGLAARNLKPGDTYVDVNKVRIASALGKVPLDKIEGLIQMANNPIDKAELRKIRTQIMIAETNRLMK